ncbi:MAG: caspase family protein [Bacteroidota bacterium]|nr:caspase family protein [Bacteroidota bacterium]
MNRTVLNFLFIFSFILVPVFIYAQTDNANVERRIALVIGNGDYLQSPLANPVNDARSMARALRGAGFDVILGENLSNKTEMKRLIRDFGFKLNKGGVGLFYYAGHGIQVEGFNFLVPVNAIINNEEEVEYEAVDAGFVISQMEAADNRLNIVILDACRNNPYARSFRSSKQGLSGMSAPTGTLIAYATAPGSVAIDGSGVNGLYTQELLAQINIPDLQIESVFKNVRAEVVKKSYGKQTPWESSSLIGDFYFYPENVPVTSQQDFVVQNETYPVTPPANNLNVKWKGKDNTYWLYVNGVDISQETSSITEGRNLVVTHSTTQAKYVLENFWDLRDNQTRSAKILTRPTNNLSNKKIKNNSGTNPLYDISPGNRPVSYKPAKKMKIIWRATSDSRYYLMVNGSEISQECKHRLIGDDLYVYHPSSGRMFLLKGYAYRRDNRNRNASLVR